MAASWWVRVAGALVALVLSGSSAGAQSITAIDPSAAAPLIARGVPVIDVRRSDEWQATGIIAGSHLITAFDAEGRLVADFLLQVEKQFKLDQPVLLICRSGNRSGAVARLLIEHAGFSHVYNVEGGVREWAKAGQPLQPCDHC